MLPTTWAPKWKAKELLKIKASGTENLIFSLGQACSENLETQKTNTYFAELLWYRNWAKAGTFVKFQIPCGLGNMIPWEKVINNDPQGTFLEREDFFNGKMGRKKEEMNYGSNRKQKSAVLKLIYILEELYNHWLCEFQLHRYNAT